MCHILMLSFSRPASRVICRKSIILQQKGHKHYHGSYYLIETEWSSWIYLHLQIRVITIVSQKTEMLQEISWVTHSFAVHSLTQRRHYILFEKSKKLFISIWGAIIRSLTLDCEFWPNVLCNCFILDCQKPMKAKKVEVAEQRIDHHPRSVRGKISTCTHIFHQIDGALRHLVYLQSTGPTGMVPQYNKLCTTRYPSCVKQREI